MKANMTRKGSKKSIEVQAGRGRRVGQTSKGGAARNGRVTPAGGNLFADLGFPPGEAKNLRLRSDLMSELERVIGALTQVEAAALLGVSQPRVSELKSGRIDRFTIDALVNMLAHAGCDTRLSVRRG